VNIVAAGCIQEPVPGVILSLQGSVFSETQLNITTPEPSSLPYSNGYSDGLSLGAKVGIAVGAILVFLFITGVCIVCIGKRRRRRVLAQKARQSGYGWDAAQHGNMAMADSSAGERTPGFFDSPQSQKPFANAWGYPQDVKSAHSLQESPITPVIRQNRTPEWPRDRKSSPLDDSGGERIEMVGVGGVTHPPPMLRPSGMR
jgi:hypothetical protein